MTIATSLKSIALLLGLLLPFSTFAQTLPEGATANRDKCLGYDLDYKKYPKPVIAKIQADMYQLYHQEVEWQKDAGRTGKPLNDGILGPITWSWMQRFCKSFALDTTADVVAAFPPRASAIATFSEGFNDAAVTLIGIPFAQWVATHRDACGLDVKQILAQGSDAALQKLLLCYRKPVAVPVSREKTTEPLPLLHTLYVLRSNDFEDMAGEAAAASVKKDAIDKIKGKRYPNKMAAQSELSVLLADLPPEQSKKLISQISEGLQEKTRYEITDQALNNLIQQPISDAQFDELRKLLNEPFTDQASFTKAINIAINKSLLATPQQPAVGNGSTADTNVSVTSVSNQAVNKIPAFAQATSKLLAQIQFASQQTYVELDQATAATMSSDKDPVAGVVIKLLKSIQNIEYPTSELIDLAIMSKILKASNICKLNASDTSDLELDSLEDKEINLLLAELKHVISPEIQNFIKNNNKHSENPNIKMSCNEAHTRAIKKYYEKRLRTVRLMYSEPMPSYTGEPILWKGGEENCGCVRPEIRNIGYGIYPYWKWHIDKKKKVAAQIFDFSTFSRVAYFGLRVKDDGTLEQINTAPNTRTLLDTKDNAAKEFIGEVRSYGGKMDWIIEKEFAGSQLLKSQKSLKDFFNELRSQVGELLTSQLDDSESTLRPLLSFGLTSQPTNGDGVTLYFKNYPKASDGNAFAKEEFKNFFDALKDDIANSDKKRNLFRAVKHHTYINIMISQSDFFNPDSVFFREKIIEIVKNSSDDEEQLKETNPEIQDRVKSLVILLLEDPYYNSLDKIYAVTDSETRALVIPLMFTDYSGFKAQGESSISPLKIDEREKLLSYIHESFGGGGFWPMTEYKNASDGKDYSGFNTYISDKFSPGHIKGSWWYETLCSYRWMLIAVMNIWLLLALIYVTSVFYIYPTRCRKLSGYFRLLEHPVTVGILLLPLFILWVYLLMAYPPLRSINIPNLLVFIILGLVVWTSIDAIKALKAPKPDRYLLQYQKETNLPTRPITKSKATEETDDTVVTDGNKIVVKNVSTKFTKPK